MNWVNAKSTDMVRIEILGEGRAVSQTGAAWVECSEQVVKLTEEVERLRNEVECFKAMKEGVAIRIADIERERDRLRAIITRLPRKDDIELSLRANNMGGLEFREDYCQCDASVGMSPCPYCAIDSVLRRVLRASEAGDSKP